MGSQLEIALNDRLLLKLFGPGLGWALLLSLFLIACRTPMLGQSHNGLSARPDQDVLRQVQKLPLSFEENRGQVAAPVHYLARGAGYSMYFEDDQAVLQISRTAVSGGRPTAARSGGQADIVKVQIAGRNGAVIPRAEEPLPGIVNYFMGDDSANWHTGIPTFQRVRYAQVYPGIDLIYHGTGGRLEFDFDVGPGAHPEQIRLHFEGATSIRLDHNGNLIIHARHESIRFEKPLIYQLDTNQRKSPVDGGFRVASRGVVSFRLGKYDAARSVVIDPILNYSTYFGPSVGATAIALDASGNAYLAGNATNDLPVTSGAFQTDPASKNHSDATSVFVTKLNSTGSALLYSTYLGGSGFDEGYAIALDSSGDAYIAGQTSSPDFPVTPGAFQTTNKASQIDQDQTGTAFVAKLNSTGTALIYSSYLGGSTESWGNGIATDDAGDAYLTGATLDTDFPCTPGAFQSSLTKSSAQEWSGYVAEVNPAGSALTYSTLLGGSGADWPFSIAVDSSGSAYVAGQTGSKDFPTTASAFQRTDKATILGGQTGFVTKLNPTGTGLVYSTFLGGSTAERVAALALDASGDAYLTGYTESQDFPVTTGVFQPTMHVSGTAYNSNAFVTELNPSGSALVYSTFLAGTATPGEYGSIIDQGSGIAVDNSGIAYVTGSTWDLDFPVTPQALESQNLGMIYSGNAGSFLAKINATATQILYATYLTGTGNGTGLDCDCTSGIALDSSGNPYVAGIVYSSDFPTTLGAFQSGLTDGAYLASFVTEFNAGEMTTLPATTTTVTSSAAAPLVGQSVTFTATVQGSSGNPPTGTVGFSVGIQFGDFPGQMGPWFTVPLDSSGSATFTTAALPQGETPIIAHYLGDASNAPSSGTTTQIVNGNPDTVTLTSSINPAPYGTPVVFTATALDSSGNPASGYVSFMLGNVQYALVPVNSAGQASWTNGTGGSPLPMGTDTVVADFYGSAYVSNSASLQETFTPLGTAPAPSFNPPAGTYSAAQSVQLSDTGTGATVYCTTDGTTPVVGTSPECSSPIEVDSSETIQAIAAMPGYTASSVVSAAYVINIPAPDFTISLNPASAGIASGSSGSVTVNIGALNGFSQSVALACSGLPEGVSAQFMPTTVTGSGSSSLTLTVAANAASNRPGPEIPPAPVATLAALVGWCRFRRKSYRLFFLNILLCTLALLSLSACGGGGTAPQQGGSTTTVTSVTITGNSGSLSHSTTLSLTIISSGQS